MLQQFVQEKNLEFDFPLTFPVLPGKNNRQGFEWVSTHNNKMVFQNTNWYVALYYFATARLRGGLDDFMKSLLRAEQQGVAKRPIA